MTALPAGPDPDAPVVVAGAGSDLGAALVVSILADSGIEARVAGAHDPGGVPVSLITGSGATVLVRRRDHAEATRLLTDAARDAAENRVRASRTCFRCGLPRAGIAPGRPCPECGADAELLARLAGEFHLVDDARASPALQGLGVLAGLLGLAAMIAALVMVVLSII